MSAPSEADWTSLENVKAFIAGETIRPLGKAFKMDDPAHVTTLLALDPAELRLVARNGRMTWFCGALAVRLYQEKRIDDALKLFDAAVEAPPTDMSILCNALWAVADANHRRGVMKERASRYLERALPQGPKNPGIFHNAVAVQLELGDRDLAIEHARSAVRWGYSGLDALKNDEWVAALRDDPRFVAAFTDPELVAEGRERVLPEALTALHALQQQGKLRDADVDFEMTGRLETPDETRSWMKAWTGREDAPFERARVFGQDGSGGMVAMWRTDRSRPMEAEPVVFFGSEGALGVVARDLADFFVLFAAGVGPLEAVEHGAEEGTPIAGVQEIVARSFPASASRSVQTIREDAAKALPDFEKSISGR
jgi:hypothetical protein